MVDETSVLQSDDTSSTAVQFFESPEFGGVRVVELEGEIYFVGRDVATALGYSNPRDALAKHVPDKFKKDGVAIHDSIGREQFPILISEAGMYKLVFKSKLPNAEKFSDWVCEDVIPSIRKTGSYTLPTAQSSEFKPIFSDVPTPFANKIKDVGELAFSLERMVPGLRRGIALAQAISIIEVNDPSFNYNPLRQILPPADHDVGHLNATQLAKKLGLGSARRVNTLLNAEGLQYKDENGDWSLTEEGMLFGEKLPYTKNGHSGYQIRWSDSVIQRITTDSDDSDDSDNLIED